MELKICHLYPDVLNLYGDRGNILCMEQRLRWRGLGVETTGVPIGAKLRAADFGLRSMKGRAEGFRVLGVTQMHCLPEAGD